MDAQKIEVFCKVYKCKMNRVPQERLEANRRHMQRMYNLIVWMPYACIFAFIWSAFLLIVLPIEHELAKCGVVLMVFVCTFILYSTMNVLDYRNRVA